MPVETTKLTEKEEIKYQRWKRTIPKNLQYEEDYDLRGFWKENPTWTADNPKVHMGDKFKLQNHSTFSNESKYYNDPALSNYIPNKAPNVQNGGYWKGNKYIPNDPLNSKVLDSTNPEIGTIHAKEKPKEVDNIVVDKEKQKEWSNPVYRDIKRPETTFNKEKFPTQKEVIANEIRNNPLKYPKYFKALPLDEQKKAFNKVVAERADYPLIKNLMYEAAFGGAAPIAGLEYVGKIPAVKKAFKYIGNKIAPEATENVIKNYDTEISNTLSNLPDEVILNNENNKSFLGKLRDDAFLINTGQKKASDFKKFITYPFIRKSDLNILKNSVTSNNINKGILKEIDKDLINASKEQYELYNLYDDVVYPMNKRMERIQNVKKELQQNNIINKYPTADDIKIGYLQSNHPQYLSHLLRENQINKYDTFSEFINDKELIDNFWDRYKKSGRGVADANTEEEAVRFMHTELGGKGGRMLGEGKYSTNSNDILNAFAKSYNGENSYVGELHLDFGDMSNMSPKEKLEFISSKITESKHGKAPVDYLKGKIVAESGYGSGNGISQRVTMPENMKLEKLNKVDGMFVEDANAPLGRFGHSAKLDENNFYHYVPFAQREKEKIYLMGFDYSKYAKIPQRDKLEILMRMDKKENEQIARNIKLNSSYDKYIDLINKRIEDLTNRKREINYRINNELEYQYDRYLTNKYLFNEDLKLNTIVGTAAATAIGGSAYVINKLNNLKNGNK